MPAGDHTHDQDEIQVRLKEADEECERLREENDRLRGMLGISHSTRNQNVSQSSLNPKSPPPAPSKFTHQKERSRSFGICFAGEKMFLPSGGKGRAASLDICQQVRWIGTPSMLQNRRIGRESGARRGYSSP